MLLGIQTEALCSLKYNRVQMSKFTVPFFQVLAAGCRARYAASKVRLTLRQLSSLSNCEEFRFIFSVGLINSELNLEN